MKLPPSPVHRAPCLSVFPRQQQALQEALLNSLPGDEQPKSGGKDGFTENRKEPAGNAPKKDHTRWILVVYNWTRIELGWLSWWNWDVQLAKVRDGSPYHRL